MAPGEAYIDQIFILWNTIEQCHEWNNNSFIDFQMTALSTLRQSTDMKVFMHVITAVYADSVAE